MSAKVSTRKTLIKDLSVFFITWIFGYEEDIDYTMDPTAWLQRVPILSRNSVISYYEVR